MRRDGGAMTNGLTEAQIEKLEAIKGKTMQEVAADFEREMKALKEAEREAKRQAAEGR